MSEMAPEAPAGGDNFLTRRIMGLPVVVWVGVVALGAYLFISHRSSSANGAVSESGGGGSARTGNTTIDKGAIQVTITQANPQPKPPVHHKKKTEHKPARHPGPVHKVTPPHTKPRPIPPPRRGGGGHKVHPGTGSTTPPRKKGAPHPDRKPAVHRATHKLKRS